jgi:hypothetical protein
MTCSGSDNFPGTYKEFVNGTRIVLPIPKKKNYYKKVRFNIFRGHTFIFWFYFIHIVDTGLKFGLGLFELSK